MAALWRVTRVDRNYLLKPSGQQARPLGKRLKANAVIAVILEKFESFFFQISAFR